MKRRVWSLIGVGVLLLAFAVLLVTKCWLDKWAEEKRWMDPLGCNVLLADPESKEVVRMWTTLPDDAESLFNLISDHKHPEIKVAAMKLRHLGKSALAVFVSHAQDRQARPSCAARFAEYGALDFTRTQEEGVFTMGYWCVWEINKMIEYREVCIPGSNSVAVLYAPRLVSQDNAREWWAKRRDWTLRDMRIEAIKWQMDMILTNSIYAGMRGYVVELQQRLEKVMDMASEGGGSAAPGSKTPE